MSKNKYIFKESDLAIYVGPVLNLRFIDKEYKPLKPGNIVKSHNMINSDIGKWIYDGLIYPIRSCHLIPHSRIVHII